MTVPGRPTRGLHARRWLLLLGICTLLRLVSLVRPCLSDDEAIYAVVGREMLLGRVLYRDVVDHKPPLIYVTYAATQALGGPTGGMRLLHILTIVSVLGTALLLADLTRRLRPSSDDDAPFYAALLYILFTTTLLDFDSLAANCELFMMLPLTASLALYSRGFSEPRPRLLIACGVLIAVAVFYKYQAGVQLPLYVAHLGLVHKRKPRRFLAACAAIGFGFLGTCGAFLGTMAAFGALGSAWFWFRFNFAYIKEGLEPIETLRRAAVRVSFVVGAASFLWVLGLRGAWRASKQARDGSDPDGGLGWLGIGWLTGSILATMVGGRFFGHYFHQVTAPLAVLAAPQAIVFWRARRRLSAVWIGVPVAGFFLVSLFHSRVLAAVGDPDPDYTMLAEFIRAHSTPSESLVVWGNSPVLYFEAERPLGSRFAFSNYMSGLSPATRTQSDRGVDASGNIVPQSWVMFTEDIAERKPKLFVDMSTGNIAGYGKFPPSRYPVLSQILHRDYEPLSRVSGCVVFKRRSTTH